MVNVKPSRFGSVRALMDAYDYLDERGIGAYGGGQFELGPGRGHIQYLASLFHPDTPNDVAPGGYNLVDPPAGPARQPARAAPEQDRAFAGSSGAQAAAAVLRSPCRRTASTKSVTEWASAAAPTHTSSSTALAAEVPRRPEGQQDLDRSDDQAAPTTGRCAGAAATRT